MQNQIFIRRASKMILPVKPGYTPLNVVATFNHNLQTLGFGVSKDVFEALLQTDGSEMARFYQRLVKDLRKMVGAHREFKPMYPGFPEQVMQMPKAQLYVNALYHYVTHAKPAYHESQRAMLADMRPVRVIELGSREEFEELCARLLAAKTPFSPQDKEDVSWLVSQYGDDVKVLLPEKIESKENLAYLGGALMRATTIGQSWAEPHIQTATDVLRLAVGLSDGDVSLAEPCRFERLRRPWRTWMLGLLEGMPNRAEDMLRWKGRWVRLGERLHPGEYARRFPLTVAAFDILRNDTPLPRFSNRLEDALARGDLEQALALLGTRPGDFARRLDHVLRLSEQRQKDAAQESSQAESVSPHAIAVRFETLAHRVSTVVLLQAMTHFRQRARQAQTPDPGDVLRIFFPKGEVAKVYGLAQALPPLAVQTATTVSGICEQTLLARFGELPPLGRCFLDPQMRNFLVPFSQRSASKTLRTLVRGSRLPLPDLESTLRFFIWWKNGRSRTDVDLSAAMFDDQCQFVSLISYYNLKELGGCHSGDIVDAPHGASEFIDVDVKRCRDKMHARYIVMCINSYTSQPFCDLPECFAGWMSRRKANSGEVFEPRTVVDKVDVAARSQICLPAIFDLERGEVIWADIALTRYPQYVNNVHGNLGGVTLMLKAMTHLVKPDLYTLFDLHIRARGEYATNMDDAQTVFAPQQGVTPFDLERISAQFM